MTALVPGVPAPRWPALPRPAVTATAATVPAARTSSSTWFDTLGEVDEATRAYLQSVIRRGEAEGATRVPCRGRWREARTLPALGLTTERERPQDEQGGEEVTLPDGLVPLPNGRVRIVARPGMGKTTLLAALHERLARAALAGEIAAVPVFIELRYWSGGFAALVAEALREHGWETTDDEAARQASTGALVLLLDGLNELPDGPAHKELARWLRTHPRVTAVETTRGPGDEIAEARVLEMQPLSDTEISAAAAAYLGARAPAMLAALAAPGRDALWEMARTPLLLTMLCSGYGELKAVPRNPAELLRHGLWQQRDRDEQARAAMGFLAHASVIDAPTMQLVLKRPRVEELLGRFLRDRGEPEANASGLCDRLLRRHLLAEPRPLALVFPHQLVQEFYVAEYLLATRHALLADRPRLRWVYLARSTFVEPLTLLLGLLPLGEEGRGQALALVREAHGLDDLLAATLIRGMRDDWQAEALPLVDRTELGPSLRVALLCVTQAPAAVARLAALWERVDVHCRWEILDTLARIATPEAADFAARLLADPTEIVENDQIDLAKAAEVIVQARAVQRHGPALIAAVRRIAAVPGAFGAAPLLQAVGQLPDEAAAEALLAVSLAQGRLLVEHWDELACPLDRAMLVRVCALSDPEETIGQSLGSCIIDYVEARGPIAVGPLWDAIGPAQRRMFLCHAPKVYAVPAACVRPLLAPGELLSEALRWVARTGESTLSEAVRGLCERLAPTTRSGSEHILVARALAAIGDDACVDRLLTIVRSDAGKHWREEALAGLVRATRPGGTAPPWSDAPENRLGARRWWRDEAQGSRRGVAVDRGAEVEALCRDLLTDESLADTAGELLVHAWPGSANVVRVAEVGSDAPGPLRAIVGYLAWRAEFGTAAELAALVEESAIVAAVIRALARAEVGPSAVAAARRIPVPAITEALLDAFGRSSPFFASDGRQAIREALLERGDPALGSRLLAVALAAHYTPRPGLAEAFAMLGDRWLDAVIDAFDGASCGELIELCNQRTEQLSQTPRAARGRLARALLAELPRDGMAWSTCKLLARLSDVVRADEVVVWLAAWRAQQLNDSPEAVVRAFAVADEQLLRWLEHSSAALRMAAAKVLQERADRGHIERLLALLAVPDAAPFAARALAVPGWFEAIPTLAELASAVRIKQTDVYTAGIAAIGGPAAAAALFRLARVEHPGAAHLLRTLSADDRSEASTAHLKDPAPAMRVLALEMLEDATPLIERVRALLADPDTAVVRAAVLALRDQEAPGLAAELWQLRAGSEAALVEAIDRTLASLPEADTWPLLLPGLRAGDVSIARVAEQVYPWYSGSRLDEAALVELLSSPTDEVRWFAVERLKPTPRHAEAMLAAVPAARDDGEIYVPQLILSMDEPLDPARRTAALRGKVLGEMHRIAEDVGQPEAERAWMAQRLALLGGLGSSSKAVKVLLGLPSGPTVLRALVDDPRRGRACLEHLSHRREPAAREVLRDVLRTGSSKQREVVLARVPDVASAEDLPWIREALERRSSDAQAGAALSPWDGSLAALQRVGTLADVGLLYRLARTQHGAWAFALLGAVAHLQGRLGRIVELPPSTLVEGIEHQGSPPAANRVGGSRAYDTVALSMSSLLQDLRQTLTTKPSGVVFIVGTGVSVGALHGSPLASLGTWAGLLAHGLRRAYDLGALDDPTLAHYQQQLHLTKPQALLGVAEVVSHDLGAPQGGEFSRWLRETVGAFHNNIGDRDVLDALARHQRRGVLLTTTNYDHLLETVTTLRATNWRHPAAVERAIAGTEPRVLHLHGEWEDPESIVLGMRSYVDVARDAHAQAVLATLRTGRTFVFVGCGAGLQDPNLGAFIKWTGEVFARSETRHFRLCLQSEVDALRREHPREQRIFPLPYGDTHADLAPFLRALLPAGADARSETPSASITRDISSKFEAEAMTAARPMESGRHAAQATPTRAADPKAPPQVIPPEEGDVDDAHALIDDLGALLAADALKFIRPIAKITGLAEDVARHQLQRAPHRQVQEIFNTTWPSDEALGDYTVAQVRRWQLTGAVARFIGLPYSDVESRLASRPGQTKVRKVFARRWKQADAEESDVEPGVSSAPEDIESKTIAFVSRHNLAWMIAEITGRSLPWVQKRIKETHGKTHVPRAFKEDWPDDDALGMHTVASCIRLGLVPRLARTLDTSPANVQQRLTDVPAQTTLRTLFREKWPWTMT